MLEPLDEDSVDFMSMEQPTMNNSDTRSVKMPKAFQEISNNFDDPRSPEKMINDSDLRSDGNSVLVKSPGSIVFEKYVAHNSRQQID